MSRRYSNSLPGSSGDPFPLSGRDSDDLDPISAIMQSSSGASSLMNSNQSILDRFRVSSQEPQGSKSGKMVRNALYYYLR